MGLKVGVSNTDTSGDETDVIDTTKNGTVDNTTTNSGSTNTGKSVTNGTVTTDASQNSTTNSGQTNVTTIGPTSSSTYNSGHTDTSQLLLTPDAVSHLIQGMMEGTQGLAAVSSGEHRSGGYNSTVGELLTNDLMSRVAGDVAARSAITKTVIGGSSSTTENSAQTTTQRLGSSYNQTDIGKTVAHNVSETDLENIIGPSTQHTIGTTTDHTQGTVDISKSSSTQNENAGWILCTELYRQGRMPARFYIYGSKEFASYDDQSKKGYYIWAVPALAHLRSKPYSLLSKVMCRLLNARAEYLAAKHGCKGARKTALGWFSVQLYWGCWILSRTVARNYIAPSVIFA